MLDNNKAYLKYLKTELDDILDQQIIISQLSTAYSFADTDNMDQYERIYTINKLIQMKKEENEAKKKAIEQARNNK
jgi:hypothetical protein